MAKLIQLGTLDLSYNEMSGEILGWISGLNRLNELNLHIIGNPELCVKGFGKCHSSRGRKYRRNLRKKKRSLNVSKWRSFHKLGFDEFEIVKLMSEDNVIGSRSSGKVYKVVLSSGAVVAVKKLWRETKDGIGIVGSEKDEFDVEVETLGKIRHKNIVRLWSCYNSGDSRLLLYEYIPNGNLADMLKSNKKSLLDWPTRSKIAIDAAEGLSYLHHGIVPFIVHRDVKSNNILLDSEFGAKVADFGVAKIVNRTSQGAVSMSVIAGSYGYIAPEYAYTLRVNEMSDIYSFGVVILELVTEKPSNHADYGENDLVKWVSSLLEQKGMDLVIDPALDSTYREKISKVLSVRFLCTNVLPINRPAMWWVVKMLREAATVPRSRSMREIKQKYSPYKLFTVLVRSPSCVTPACDPSGGNQGDGTSALAC
ncbi:Receptor-like protein kinase [Arachis hypogaea]|nr:Receptor-like protein kinase [Arachis hypogaea]